MKSFYYRIRYKNTTVQGRFFGILKVQKFLICDWSTILDREKFTTARRHFFSNLRDTKRLSGTWRRYINARDLKPRIFQQICVMTIQVRLRYETYKITKSTCLSSRLEKSSKMIDLAWQKKNRNLIRFLSFKNANLWWCLEGEQIQAKILSILILFNTPKCTFGFSSQFEKCKK